MRIVLRGRELGRSGSAKNQSRGNRVGSLLGGGVLAYGVEVLFDDYCPSYFYIDYM